MVTFDGALNAIIPWVIAIIGVYILYRPLKEPLAPLFRGIGNFMLAIKRKITGEDIDESLLEQEATLQYE